MGEAAAAETLELEGPAMLSSARRFVAECLARRHLDALVTDAQLVVSELATNVFLHVGGPATLSIATNPSGARLEVHDTSSVPPVRLRAGADGMTGRGLHLVEGMASRWGVTQVASGKVVWAELDDDGSRDASPPAEMDEDALLAMWTDDGFDDPVTAPADRATVHIGRVPTRLVLAAKAHVDNLVREFTLVAAGSASGVSEEVPDAVTSLIDVVVDGFADQRQALKRLALDAAAEGREEVDIELPVPADVGAALAAAQAYLDALEQADAFCRAARLLTLESPPQLAIFHRWYVGELIARLRALGTAEVHTPEPFVDRLLEEFDGIATAHRLADRGARLHSLAVALSRALTPQAVAQAVLDEGVTAMGASGGVVLLASSPTLEVTGAVGHEDDVMARLRDEHPDAALPAAEAMRTGEAVWLETPAERTRRFPDLVGFEPATVAMCAVPLVLGERRLGALRFSFATPRLFDAEERRFVTALAAQTAQALLRAELQHQRRDMATRLRAAMLPAALPSVPGVDVAAVHHPPGGLLDIGGSFYDLWPAGAGRHAVAIGDACDGGPEAAAEAGLIRHTLRALSSMSLPLPQVVRGVDDALRASGGPGMAEVARSCGLIVGLLHVGDDGVQVDLAGGGHPAPLVVRAGGRVEAVALGGSRLGSDDAVVVDSCRIDLAPGDALVLLTAVPGRLSDRAGMAVDGVAAASAGAASTLAAVEAALRADGHAPLEDVAILVLRCS